MHPLDEQRMLAIDAALEERAKDLSPEIKYTWQEYREDLEAIRQAYVVVLQKALAFEQALQLICEVSPNTSVAGERMREIALEALKDPT